MRVTAVTKWQLLVNNNSRRQIVRLLRTFRRTRVNSHVPVYICIFARLPDGYWKSCARHPVAQIPPPLDGRKCLLDCASSRVSQQLSRNFPVLPVAVFVCLSSPSPASLITTTRNFGRHACVPLGRENNIDKYFDLQPRSEVFITTYIISRIAPEHIPRIYRGSDPFYRFTRERGGEEGEKGIILTIIRKLARVSRSARHSRASSVVLISIDVGRALRNSLGNRQSIGAPHR